MFDTLAFGTGNPGMWIVILILAMLLFGAGRIPEMMRNMGSGMKEFKKGLQEDDDNDKAEKEKKD